MDIGSNNSPHDTPGRIVGGFMGSTTIQKTGKLWSNGWTDWESILHIMQMNLGMDKG